MRETSTPGNPRSVKSLQRFLPIRIAAGAHHGEWLRLLRDVDARRRCPTTNQHSQFGVLVGLGLREVRGSSQMKYGVEQQMIFLTRPRGVLPNKFGDARTKVSAAICIDLKVICASSKDIGMRPPMSNRGFYHNLDPNVSGLAQKVEVSGGQTHWGSRWVLADPSGVSSPPSWWYSSWPSRSSVRSPNVPSKSPV